MSIANRLASWGFIWALTLFLGTGCAQTQVYTTRSPDVSGAARLQDELAMVRLGRVAEVVGAAQTWDAEQRAWVPLFMNRTVTVGDRIRTEPGARVEIQVGTLRVFVGPVSDVELPALDASRTLIRLASGSMAVQLRQAEWAQALELLTDEVRLQPLGVGLFRVDRSPVGGNSVSVPRVHIGAHALQGLLRINHPQPRQDIRSGQGLEWWFGAQSAMVETSASHAGSASQDSFGLWLSGLSLSDPVAAAPGAMMTLPSGTAPPLVTDVPREMTGIEGLDGHGRWERHPDFGMVWWPTSVAPGWEPYRYGRWNWTRQGWVWWEDTPWGFAPYHYGRWVSWRGRWVWAPRLSRPHPPVVVPSGPQPSLRDFGRDPREERQMRVPRWDRRAPSPEPVSPAAASGAPAATPLMVNPSIPTPAPVMTPSIPREPAPSIAGPRELPRMRIDPPGGGRERPERDRSDRERSERDRLDRERRQAL